MLKIVVFAAALSFMGRAQDAEKAPAFEVASIKPSEPGGRGMGFSRPDGGRVVMKNVTLRLLVTFAWDIRDHQLLGGPSWLDTAHFDIVAKTESEIPRTPAGNSQIQLMVRSLLVERFGLVTHRETREQPIYELVVAKGGPKLAAAADPDDNSLMMGRGKIEGKHQKTEGLARLLANPLGRTVVDQTELTGYYDFTMQWAPDAGESVGPKGLPEAPREPQASDGPSLFTAIQEQLGLKLEGHKGPVEMLVIDKAEKPSEN
jgi:uncharacterized protein (TIGR03435 family)